MRLLRCFCIRILFDTATTNMPLSPMVLETLTSRKVHVADVTLAKKRLKEMKLFSRHGSEKSWDTYNMIEIVNTADRNCFILDVGCISSPILPMLKRLGFRNLYGCDFVLESKYNASFMKIGCRFYKREYLPIMQMYNDGALNLSIQNLENTNYPDDMFE